MPIAAENIRLGGWIVSLYNAIRDFNLDDASFDDYEAIILAARAAELVSSIRGLGPLTGEKFDSYRRLSLLKPRMANQVLVALEQLQLVEVQWSAAVPRSIVTVEAKVSGRAGVMEAAASIFSQDHPSAKARCLLEVLEGTVDLPVKESDLLSRVSALGFDEPLVRSAISNLVDIGMVARTVETESGESLIHNPHTFKAGAVDTYKLLSGLSDEDKAAAMALLEHVKLNPGVPFPAGSNQRIINLLVRVGAIDVSGVQLAAKKTVGQFPTAPEAWGVFSAIKAPSTSKDLIDDSKLLLNSLRYGEYYSYAGRGRITSPVVLLSALIDRGQVGAATAIGEDYPLPLARGIVSITESRLNPGRFFMELRKKDVAESVLEVFQQNVILPDAGVVTPEEAMKSTDSFTSPETMRFRKELPGEFIRARDNLIFDLRTYRNRK